MSCETTAIDVEIPVLVLESDIERESVLRKSVTNNLFVAVLYTCLGSCTTVSCLVEELSVLSITSILETTEATDLSTFIETEEIVA